MDADFMLFLRMKRGEEDAVESFVRKYYADILHYCGWHIFDPGIAEDLTQETFERFFLSLDRYCHRGKAKAYLYTIAGNLCRDYQKKEKEIPLPPEEGVFDGSTGADPADAAEKAACRLEIRKAVSDLPTPLQQVVILYYFHGLKQREIAKVLQIGLPLVKYRLRQAKNLLAERLKGRG